MTQIARILAPFAILMVLGCSSPSDSKDDKYTTILWERDSQGEYRLYTDDPDNYSQIHWRITDENYRTGKITVTRKSGDEAFGSGFVFGATSLHDFYYVVVDQMGYYLVGVFVDGEPYDDTGWLEDTSLNEGLGATNTIEVDTGSSGFTVTFNDEGSHSFTNVVPAGGMGPIGEFGPEDDEELPIDMRASQFLVGAAQGKLNNSRSVDLSRSGQAKLSLPRR